VIGELRDELIVTQRALLVFAIDDFLQLPPAAQPRLTQTRCPFSLSRLVKVTKNWASHLQGQEGRLPGL